MILRWPAYSAILLSFLLLCSLQVEAKKDRPGITEREFENPAGNAFYFEDSQVILFQDINRGNVWRSADGGEKWSMVEAEGAKGMTWALRSHPFDKHKAYMLGLEHIHWITEDRGETWTKFETDASPALFEPTLFFHGRDSKKVLFHGGVCNDSGCEGEILYTIDNFKTAEKLRDNVITCLFARTRPEFETSEDDTGDDRIICIVRGRSSNARRDFRIVVSDDYFKTEYEPTLEGDRTVKGMLDMATQSKYFLAAARAEGTDELALYVTDDAKEWHRAEFSDHKLKEDAYTVLESTSYSLQIDVMTTKIESAMGVLFTSNSNGTYFTRNVEHTNRDQEYKVDFEKVSGIQGIVIVNVVENWEEVEKTDAQRKKIQSRISFDDGRTFRPLKSGKRNLHLHSVTDAGYRAHVFSSPAPGVVMGVGNTGSKLKEYNEGDLWVSNDAGLTWDRALDGAHRYEFGDQGSVLVAVYDKDYTSEIQYSIDHGKTWTPVDVGKKFLVRRLMTTPDSAGLKFVMFATVEGEDKKSVHTVFSIDFGELHERKCDKDKDFEDWPARLDDKGEPDCLMGHKQFYRRRKANSDCFIGDEFKNPVPRQEQCTCTAEDFECDFNFVRDDDGKCVPSKALTAPTGACKGSDDTYKGSSGWRLIPGNDCNRENGENLDKEVVDRPCGIAPVKGEISNVKTHFKTDSFWAYHYLQRTESGQGDDETIVMQTGDGHVYLSKDHGKVWDEPEILKNEKITGIYPNQYLSDVIFFTTDTTKAFYSIDRGNNIQEFKGPEEPNKQGLAVLRLHPKYENWLIWTGGQGCKDEESPSCHSVAFFSTDRGYTWGNPLRYVRKCDFIPEEGWTNKDSQKLVFCEQHKDEDPKQRLQLVSSADWFTTTPQLHFSNLVDFATKSEFIVVASRASDATLKVDASVDGKNFADAEFPHGFVVEHQHAYTVLKSDTHAVFLHVTVNAKKDQEYGAIIKSNSNGTSYVMVHRAVNRNGRGYVDFEKVQGLEGVDVINVVSNVKEAEKGRGKRLQTMITHNDGALYSLLAPPTKDVDGKDWGCPVEKMGTPKCALHLHGFTERPNMHNTMSSPTAVGLMVAFGNVGDHLTSKEEADTFMSTDGGVNWKNIRKGPWLWEFGDQGSIVLIVKQWEPTTEVWYSRDEGETWLPYEFSKVPMQIHDVSTVPADTSRQFLLWGTETGKDANNGVFTVNIDFTGLTDRQCYLNEDYPAEENVDYYIWEPQHPLSEDKCIFGHIAQYHRKRLDRECYNGRKINKFHMFVENCPCTRRDYECDYNYEATDIGDCKLVKGYKEPDHSIICTEVPGTTEYFDPSGFRRIPISTCEGGHELDKIRTRHDCKGYEHRISATGLFFAIAIPISLAAVAGYWMYYKWDGKFGQIRLGDGGGGPSISRESPFIAYPVAVVAGTVAVVGAIPLLVTSLWRSARGWLPVGQRTYASRQSFAARRGEYVGVVEDEDELLGDDDEEGDDV